MEFMSHLEQVNRLWRKDNRILLEHISLYYALFTWWYCHRNGEQVAISSERMMQRSKIKSKEIYEETLEELDRYGYITYRPSNVKGQPATIAIHSFDLETKVKTSTDERELVFKGFTSDILFDWFIRRRRA
jgi:putative lipase involved disintegration of autophagic bodies